MALVSRVGINVSATLTNVAGLVNAAGPLSEIFNTDFASGVAAGQADVLYTTQATILTAATLTIDLKGGGLTDPFGVAINPVKLKALYIKSAPSNTTILTILGNAAAVPILNTVATTLPLLPGGVFLYTAPPLAGVAVTAATGDIIQIVNAAGASAVVNVIILGTSA
jgi:hypothetical protein